MNIIILLYAYSNQVPNLTITLKRNNISFLMKNERILFLDMKIDLL